MEPRATAAALQELLSIAETIRTKLAAAGGDSE
jgi:hypothetical protein